MRLMIIAVAALLATESAHANSVAVPFDEQTLDRIEVLNRNISDHYEELQTAESDLEQRRATTAEKLEAADAVLSEMDAKLAKLRRTPDAEPALRSLEEHRIEVKSRYLEALAEKHAIDLEATRAFEVHGSGILINLERLAEALEESLGKDGESGIAESDAAFHSLQRGTAVALSALEEWGALSRDDPRFRALWATSRILNRNLKQARGAAGMRMTVDLVRERTFVVRSLIDQARAMRVALDHQGLLLQVAAQNQMLRLHFNRLGVINGLELPDLDLDDSARRILEDIEEEPYSVADGSSGDALAGFDDCLLSGVCR